MNYGKSFYKLDGRGKITNENNEVVSDETAKAVKDKPPVDPTARYRNPLAYGKVRNDLCICGSGKKIKKCHGRDRGVSYDEAQEIRGLILRYTAAKDALRAKALKYAKEKLEEGQEVDPRELAAMTYHDEIVKRMKEVKSEVGQKIVEEKGNESSQKSEESEGKSKSE